MISLQVEKIMRRAAMVAGLGPRLAFGAAIVTCLHADGFADDLCRGRQLLPNPRPATSCQEIVPQVYTSPDGELQALVSQHGHGFRRPPSGIRQAACVSELKPRRKPPSAAGTQD